MLQGGPGQSAVSLAEFYGGESWRAARRTRTILLVDQRGTGESNPLSCDYGGREGAPQTWLYEMFADDAVRACRRELAARADLSEYNTENAVRDLEEVRARLGYERINLYGTSYGTRVALRYLELHPARVRSLVLKGVVEPEGVIPASFARDTERSIGLVIAACAADAACARAYPTLRRDYRAMRARLARGPVSATVEDGKSVVLSEGVIASSFRSALQGTGLAVRLPALIAAAARDDYTPIARLVLQIRRAASSAVHSGMMLSVICAEDAPYLAGARDPQPGLLGGYWRDRTLAACRIWDVRADPAAFRTMRRHRTPALLISGHFDPATPPEHAERARRLLPNSAHLVVQSGSHSFGGMQGCADIVIARFLDTAEPRGLDLSCGARGRLPDFVPPQ